MISSWGVMQKSDFCMGGHAEIWFLFSSAMTISRIFWMYGNLSMTSLLLTHTGIAIYHAILFLSSLYFLQSNVLVIFQILYFCKFVLIICFIMKIALFMILSLCLISYQEKKPMEKKLQPRKFITNGFFCSSLFITQLPGGLFSQSDVLFFFEFAKCWKFE